eukprot:s336_g3.t1
MAEVLAIPPPSQQSLGLPEPAGSKVAILHARNIDQFLAQQPVTVLLIYKAGRCDHCQALSPEFTRAAELVEQMMLQQFAKYNHDDKANLEHDIGDSERPGCLEGEACLDLTRGVTARLDLRGSGVERPADEISGDEGGGRSERTDAC